MSYLAKPQLMYPGATAAQVQSFVEDGYDDLQTLLGVGDGGLDNENVHPMAAIQEDKISGPVDQHPHFGKFNLGEEVIGDTQLQWHSPHRTPGAGVKLIRTLRPNMRLVVGRTAAVMLENVIDTDTQPSNVMQRVSYGQALGGTSPFTIGSQVHVTLTPHVYPIGTAIGDSMALVGWPDVEFLVVGSNWEGFDLWIYTGGKAQTGVSELFFEYAALGWEVI